MQIVIDISEKEYKKIGLIVGMGLGTNIYEIVAKGVVLPKGHGRLIDGDEVLKAMDTWDKFGYTETGCFVREPDSNYVPYVYYEDMVKAVSGMPTIIEADKENE